MSTYGLRHWDAVLLSLYSFVHTLLHLDDDHLSATYHEDKSSAKFSNDGWMIRTLWKNWLGWHTLSTYWLCANLLTLTTWACNQLLWENQEKNEAHHRRIKSPALSFVCVNMYNMVKSVPRIENSLIDSCSWACASCQDEKLIFKVKITTVSLINNKFTEFFLGFFFSFFMHYFTSCLCLVVVSCSDYSQ